MCILGDLINCVLVTVIPVSFISTIQMPEAGTIPMHTTLILNTFTSSVI